MNQPIMDYTMLQNSVWRLKAQYPVVRVKTVGKSVVGRSIYALEMGRDTADIVLLLGTFWGTDAVSGLVLLQFMEQLAKGITRNQKVAGVDLLEIFRNRKIVVIPVVNPDGREICARGAHCGGLDSGRIRRLSSGDTGNWEANARGVDITRNFDFGFDQRKRREHRQGIYGPAPMGYGGTGPESEPETVAVADYCRRYKIQQALALYPGSGEIFWRSEEILLERSEQMANVLALCAGYDVEACVGHLVDTGFRNWFCKTVKRPAFDVMLRCYQENCVARNLYPDLEEMLILSCLL